MPSPSTMTTAGWPPEWLSIQATCSSSVRGTMSNVTVDVLTSRLYMSRIAVASRRSASRIDVSDIAPDRSRRQRLERRHCRVDNLYRFAPLAQSAEHFHGKEGVYGSSP